MAEVAALATPSIRKQVGNKGRIAEQGALTWVLHSQAAKWGPGVLFERNFTINGGEKIGVVGRIILGIK